MNRAWILVKLGGSLLTDKSQHDHPRPEVIARLAQEIASARQQMSEALILGHGSGSFGHVAASRFGLGQAQSDAGRGSLEPQGISITQDAAARLHRLLIKDLIDAGAHPFSLAPASFVVARAGRPVRGFIEPLLRAVDQGLMPLVFGDVVMDESLGASICSTEQTLLFLIRRLRRRGHTIQRLIWLGETDGIYDQQGETIAEVRPENYLRVLKAIHKPAGTDVTGGMLLRLKTAWQLARMGIESRILDGTAPGVLESALLGDKKLPGTRIVARDGEQ